MFVLYLFVECSRHAVFCWPNVIQEMKVEDHVSFIQTLLPSTHIEAQETWSLAGKHRVEQVLCDIWPSYITGLSATPERKAFQLKLQSNCETLQMCKDKHGLNMASCLAKDEAKKTLCNKLQGFFATDNVSYFLWYKIAVRADILPGGFDNFMTLNTLQQRALFEGEQIKREQACGSR